MRSSLLQFRRQESTHRKEPGVSGREGKKKGQDQGKEGKKVKRRAPEAFGGERVWWSKSRDEPRVV